MPFDDSTNDNALAAWSPSPNSSPRPRSRGVDGSLPQLFVSSLVLPEYVKPKTPERTANKSGKRVADEIQVDQLSPRDKELLSMYRKMATSEGNANNNLHSAARKRENTAKLSVVHVEADAALYDIVRIQKSPLERPSDEDMHASAIRHPANSANDDEQTDLAKSTSSPQRSPINMTNVPSPMMIQSYTPRRPSTAALQQAEVRVETMGEMQDWRDKASSSRPASAGRPLTISRPVSARQHRQQQEVEAELASAVSGILVQGHQMDQGRALQHMLEDETTKSTENDERIRAYVEAEIYEDFEGPDGDPQYQKLERSSDNYHIHQAPAVALGVRIASESCSVTSQRSSPAPSSQLSRPTSRPTSAGTSRADANLLPILSQAHTPALIAAEQEFERCERVKRQNQQLEAWAHRREDEEPLHRQQHDLVCGVQSVHSEQEILDESGPAGHVSAAAAASDETSSRHIVGDDLMITTREHATTEETHVDVTNVPRDDGPQEGSRTVHSGFVLCPSCQKMVAISADQVQQQQIVFKYFHENPETHTPTTSRPASSLDRVPEVWPNLALSSSID